MFIVVGEDEVILIVVDVNLDVEFVDDVVILTVLDVEFIDDIVVIDV